MILSSEDIVTNNIPLSTATPARLDAAKAAKRLHVNGTKGVETLANLGIRLAVNRQAGYLGQA